MLYIVGTPIGNLQDITLRALDVLKSCDRIVAEDTRRTANLLNFYQIKTDLKRFNPHTQDFSSIIDYLMQGKNVALVTDAGTPNVSDPGRELIRQIVDKKLPIKIEAVPGVSAITTLMSVAEVPMDRFLFLGFPPRKNKRNKTFAKIVESEVPVVFFESPFRVIKTLEGIETIFNQTPREDKEEKAFIIVGRELTKSFQEIIRGTISDVIGKLKAKDGIKGEFTIIFYRGY